MAGMAEWWRLEELPELEPPFEVLELRPGEEKVFTVIDYKLGKAVIHPRWPGAPSEKEVAVLRLYVPREEKEFFPYYYDVASKRLIAQLITILREADVPRHKVKIRVKKEGVPPKAYFAVTVLAVE